MKYFKKPLPRFSDSEVWQELKRQCYDGTIEYEDFPADEYKYFDMLRITYLKYKFAGMPKTEAAKQASMMSGRNRLFDYEGTLYATVDSNEINKETVFPDGWREISRGEFYALLDKIEKETD